MGETTNKEEEPIAAVGSSNNGNAAAAVDVPKIVLLGDSLTQLGWEGWCSQLANAYQRRADVINRGMSGYNTDWYLLLKLPQTMEAKNAALVTVFFGANDASLPDLGPRQHVPIDRYETNLQTLLDEVRDNWSPKHVILIGPPPVYHKQRLEYQVQRYGKDKATGELERTNENTGKYSVACGRVAAKNSIPFVDLWTKMQEDGENDEHVWGPKFFYDGLHFSKGGQDFVYNQIMDTIATNFSDDLQIVPDPHTKQWCNSASKGGTNNSLKQFAPFHDYLSPSTTSINGDTTKESNDTDENDKKRKREDEENKK